MDYRLLAKPFRSSELKKVAAGNFCTIKDLLSTYEELASLDDITEFYNEVYKLLVKNYRNEYVVKNEIVNKILLGRHSMKTTAMMSELRTGNNIADCVVFNGYSTCYEIKTEMDSLTRLENQIESYILAYDKTYVVTHKTHLEHVLSIYENTPSFGILELTKQNTLKTIKDAPLREEFDFDITFDALRKPEYKYIAEHVLGPIPEMPNSLIYDYCKEIYSSMKKSEANKLFKSCIKKFRANDHIFINSLPKSLKNVGISYQLSRKEKNNLICFLMNKQSVSLGEKHVLSLPQG